jgi:hypothetical protein
MRIRSINGWLPEQEVELCRVEGGFIVLTDGLEHIILNQDGKEVLRCWYMPPANPPVPWWNWRRLGGSAVGIVAVVIVVALLLSVVVNTLWDMSQIW